MILKDVKSALDFLELDKGIPKTSNHSQTNLSISVYKRYLKYLEDVENL